jgi:hypothetical protein
MSRDDVRLDLPTLGEKRPQELERTRVVLLAVEDEVEGSGLRGDDDVLEVRGMDDRRRRV